MRGGVGGGGGATDALHMLSGYPSGYSCPLLANGELFSTHAHYLSLVRVFCFFKPIVKGFRARLALENGGEPGVLEGRVIGSRGGG